VDDYLLLTEFEFPQYARAQCATLQELHRQGADIRQVHPWLDELLGIHEFFASGRGPQDLPASGPVRAVYEREKAWTRELLAFYEASRRGAFEGIVRAVMDFARADALKIWDMDEARARAVAGDLGSRSGVYVECGSIHHAMVLLMMRALGPGRAGVVHLMEQECKPRHGSRRLLPPGDVLTFRHLLGAPADEGAESLLAARVVVYNKLIAKEELPTEAGEHPHMDNEAAVIGFVSQLSFEACRELWGRIRALPTAKAREAVRLESQ
jgi:hypothetical protein